jgi:cell wall-associated NlpC family hydrolase
MNYRAVGQRCAVDIDSLNLKIPSEEAISILINSGFNIVNVDIVDLAHECIGVSKYRRGAKPDEAPKVFDCSSFIKWLYGQCGIWLPRRSIQQMSLGEEIEIDSIRAGDAVFVSGVIDYYHDDPTKGVGHVGIASSSNTVIHAANKKIGVAEISLDKFIGKDKFRGIRRYVPSNRRILTFKTPTDRNVEIEDDFRWIILQSLPKS